MVWGAAGHLKAVLALPVTVLIVIPAVILFWSRDVAGIWGWDFPPGVVRLVLGSMLMVGGLSLLFAASRLFATIGRGTLAPWEPPTTLVVAGVYKYVRNPMITGVLIVLLGEAVLLGSIAVLLWCACFFLGNCVYFRVSEEPDLVKRFGREYIEYRKNVPAWLPRLRPWHGD
jgi:protein-S-isoprenylcysteine O-methyltransferase Ste14